MKKKREMKHGYKETIKGSVSKAGNTVIKDSDNRVMEEKSQTGGLGTSMKKAHEVPLNTEGKGEVESSAVVENVWFSPGRAGMKITIKNTE